MAEENKSSVESTMRETRGGSRKKIRRKTRSDCVGRITGEYTIAELCRRESVHPNMYYKWRKDFLEAGKQRLVGEMRREADSQEVLEMHSENKQLKAVVAELTLTNGEFSPQDLNVR